MNARRQSLAELDAATARASELADEYERKLTTLERNRFCPEPQVAGGGRLPDPPAWPGPGSVAVVAQIFPTKREAKQALRLLQRGDRRG